jgi:hypothetical protein
MVNKRFWLVILAMAMVFGFIFTGCELFEDELPKGYTFEFAVYNNNVPGYSSGSIVKIEFLNGNNPQAPVLKTETVNLSNGEYAEFKVSGFTENGGSDNKRAYAIKFTYEDGHGSGGTSSSVNNKKILVFCAEQTISFVEEL